MRSPLAVAALVPLVGAGVWAAGRVLAGRLLDPAATTGDEPPSPLAGALATFTCGSTVLVMSVLALGSAGWLRTLPLAALMAGALGLSLWAALRPPGHPRMGRPVPAFLDPATLGRDVLLASARTPGAAVAVFALAVAAAVCAIVLWQGWRLPPLAYDALMYHLVFPAEWIQRGRLALVPTVFAAPANSYFPANGEATFAAALLATGDERLVNLAQFPFLLAGGAAVAGIARLLGARWSGALLASALFAGAPEVATQAGSALVDVDFAAAFLLAIFFLLEYRARGATGALVLAGLAAGFLAGTKTLGVVFAVLLVPVAILCVTARRERDDPLAAPLLLALAAALPLGGFWYVRNWEATGNPLFPLELRIGGALVFPGVHGREEMLASHFHVPALGAASAALQRLWGPGVTIMGRFTLPLLLLPVGAGIGAAAPALLRFPRGRLLGLYLLALPWLMLVFHAAQNPYNTQYRFLLPASGLSLVPLALAAGGARTGWADRLGRGASVVAAALLPAMFIGFGPADPLDPRAEVFPFPWAVIAAFAAVVTAVFAILARRAAKREGKKTREAEKTREEARTLEGAATHEGTTTRDGATTREAVEGVEPGPEIPDAGSFGREPGIPDPPRTENAIEVASTDRTTEASGSPALTPRPARVTRGPWPDAPETPSERRVRVALAAIPPAAVIAFVTLLALARPIVARDYLDFGGEARDGQRAFIWGRLRQDPAPRVIAYTGFNQPYPLYGEDLRNRVLYVAVDGRQDFNLHDYSRIAGAPAGVTGLRSYKPAYERQQPSRDAWLRGLEAHGVEKLVVSRFTAWDLEEYPHGPAGFPVEEQWARSMPWKFRPEFVTADLRVYEILRDKPQQPSPDAMTPPEAAPPEASP